MASSDEYLRQGREFARRFLQTAVIVDDEAYMAPDDSDFSGRDVVAPRRGAVARNQADAESVGRRGGNSLDAKSVIEAFAALGVICSVVGPTGSTMETMRLADIVVLDWLLKADDGQSARELLRELLGGEGDRNALRLVAIYTGEAGLEDICAKVINDVREAGFRAVEHKNSTTISYGPGRVVLYAKSEVKLVESLKERSVREKDLPERLVEDFAEMTEGLLPRIALTSLTAVREGAHMVLDRFCAALDPAFLAHRSCLSDPDDAEQHIVKHVAEELRGLMDNEVAAQSPAGADAVEGWIRRKNDGSADFEFGDRSLNVEQTITLATRGLEASGVLKNSAFEGLSAGFAGAEVDDFDQQLAWIMSFRTVFNAPKPTLWLGTVVTDVTDGEDVHLICMRPRCDSVRLEGETSFLFLRLVEPTRMKEQLVVKLGGEYKRLGISLDTGGLVQRKFQPSGSNLAITATRREPGGGFPNGGFQFVDTGDRRYMWRGELKGEYAQRIAQQFATALSRVAVDESEWLRRMARR